MSDFPFDATARAAEAATKAGHTVHQKYTCTGCRRRLIIEEPNRFFEYGHCDKCGSTTNIRARGCNYVLISSEALTETEVQS